MNEISSSIAEAIKKRTTSATLGSYMFFWLTFHWQGVYATLFVSEEKIYEKFSLLKNEYVDTYFFGYDNAQHPDVGFLLGYAIPAIMTYLFIWILPHIVLIRAYRQEQRHKNERRKIKFEEEIKIQDLEKEVAVQTTETINAEIKLADKKSEAKKKDPKIVWKNEFSELEQNQKEYKNFKFILESMYAYSGKIRVEEKKPYSMPGEKDTELTFSIPPAALKMADVRGLIRINTNGTITLTDKGKYFAELYQY